MTTPVSRWTKAALLGSLWAAVEIVLGSFLHNIGMPLTGTVLSAFGVCLMVAGTQLWPERGIIWRAGVLCALMKSVSPSAVIIGPMVGITLEAFLLEGTTRLLGRTAPGYIVGGALATTLPIFQKLIGLVFTYGPDAARLFVAMVDFATKSLRISGLDAVDLILIWLALNLLLGTSAAILGMRAGRYARTLPDSDSILNTEQTTYSLGSPQPGQRFSLLLLATHSLVIPCGFLTIRDWPVYFSFLSISAYAGLTFFLYPRVRRRFSRPRPWIEFTLVALLAGLFLGTLNPSAGAGPWAGTLIGLQMALRAVLVVVAFSAISIELRNPAVVQCFLRRGLSPLAAALDVAFQALPAMMHAIGEERTFLRHPAVSTARVLATARAWLAARPQENSVIIITGSQGSGKTTFLLKLTEELRSRGIPPAGIAAPVLYQEGKRLGYDLLDLETGERVPLARRSALPAETSAGPFSFLADGIAFGEDVLASATERIRTVIALDEIGPLELAGKGWSSALSAILASPPRVLLLVVRPDLIREVNGRWDLKPGRIWRAGEISPGEAARLIRTATAVQDPERAAQI
jgi:nucleoside-triphosphatase THEP1